MKTTNFFEMTNDELQVKLAALKQELFDLRFKHKAGNLDNNSKIAATKKDIARCQRELGLSVEPAKAAKKSAKKAK